MSLVKLGLLVLVISLQRNWGDLLEVARVPPAVDQVECHPSWQQTKLREFCKSKGVHLSVSVQILFHCVRLLFEPIARRDFYCL